MRRTALHQSLLVLLLLAGASGSAIQSVAAEIRVGALHVQDPWARATIGKGRVGVAYMRLRNSGAEEDRLIGAKTPVAERAALHSHRMTGDVMRMRAVDAVPIPAGGHAVLEPGGFHLMLMRLTRSLKKGERFPLTLIFARAGNITVDVEVKSATARSAHGMGRHGG